MCKVRIGLWILMVGSLATLSGCLVAAVGLGIGAAAGTAYYVKGELESYETAKVDTVYTATINALQALDLKDIRQRKDAMSAKITAKDSKGNKINIKLAQTPEGPTRITIRVGVFGNEDESRLILNKIKESIADSV